MLRVAVSDFPVYDGSVPPDDFIAQCRRLASLGGIPDDQLSAIMTVRCRGLALQVLEGAGDQTNVQELLKKAFGDGQPATAATQLSTAQKGGMPVLEYSLLIRRLVHNACPEFFDETDAVKKICVPAYQAALYRHFLVGLSSEERVLLSRQGVKSFDAAVTELQREESVSSDLHASRRVHWSETAAVRGAGGGRSASLPSSPRRGLSPVLSSACRGRRVSRSPEPMVGGAAVCDCGRSQDRAATARWSRRESSSSSRSPDAGALDMEPSPDRRRFRGRGSGDWRRRPRSPSSARRAGRPAEQQRAARDPNDRRPSGGGGGGRLAGPTEERRREIQCWSCRGFGHLKRHCPNGQLGRLAGEW